MTEKKYWGYGAGFPGCEYDHSLVVGTREEAIEAATRCYNLDDYERESLVEHGRILFTTEDRGVTIHLFETPQEPEPPTLKTG